VRRHFVTYPIYKARGGEEIRIEEGPQGIAAMPPGYRIVAMTTIGGGGAGPLLGHVILVVEQDETGGTKGSP
jgi:hypothetical protein